MLFGDPYKVAFLLEVVDEWSDDYFKNGLLFLFLNGEAFPCHKDKVREEVLSVSLTTETYPMLCSGGVLNSFDFIESDFLFALEPARAFIFMLEKHFGIETNGEDWCYGDLHDHCFVDNFYGYTLSPQSLMESGCCAFAVASGGKVRVLACNVALRDCDFKSSNIKNMRIREIVLDWDYLHSLIGDLQFYVRGLC